jgi:hypothetical protein
MTEPLEPQLREIFAQQANYIPEPALMRVRHGEYKPRSPLKRPGAALGSLVVMAAIAAITLSLAGLGANTQRAFAGWTPAPTSPTTGQVARAVTACKADLTTLAARDGKWQTVITDTRGPYTIVLLADAKGDAHCLSGPGAVSGPAINGGEGSSTGTRFAAPAGHISVGSWGFSRAGDEHPYMDISGHAGAGVKAVTFVLSDGTHVAASVTRGWFLAWWPGIRRATSAQVTTAVKTTTLPLHDPIPPRSLGS